MRHNWRNLCSRLACCRDRLTRRFAPAQTHLKIMVFPGLSNFSLFAAQHQNLFAKHGLASTPEHAGLRRAA